MIDANEPTPGGVVKQETPARITTSMIIADLDNGIDLSIFIINHFSILVLVDEDSPISHLHQSKATKII